MGPETYYDECARDELAELRDMGATGRCVYCEGPLFEDLCDECDEGGDE